MSTAMVVCITASRKSFEEEIPFACCRPTFVILVTRAVSIQLNLPGTRGSRSDDAGCGRWSAAAEVNTIVLGY